MGDSNIPTPRALASPAVPTAYVHIVYQFQDVGSTFRAMWTAMNFGTNGFKGQVACKQESDYENLMLGSWESNSFQDYPHPGHVPEFPVGRHAMDTAPKPYSHCIYDGGTQDDGAGWLECDDSIVECEVNEIPHTIWHCAGDKSNKAFYNIIKCEYRTL